MKLKIAAENSEAEKLIPPEQPDGSRIGVNYADAYLKALNSELEGGLKISCRRRGLKITLSVGDQQGAGLMRRLEHGPDPRRILRAALQEAAGAAGIELTFEDGAIFMNMES